MSPSRGICEHCGSEVTSEQIAAYPVNGWEIERQGGVGGANQIAGKKRLPNRIVHARCLEWLLKGGEQMELSA